MEAHLAGRSPAYAIEYRVQRDDGSWHWVRARGLCVRDADGQPLRVAGSVSDIDAQRRAEDQLRESEERYVIATTGSKEGHWVWNLATDELFVSPMMREIFELQPDAQFTTRTEFGELIKIHPDDVGELQKQRRRPPRGRYRAIRDRVPNHPARRRDPLDSLARAVLSRRRRQGGANGRRN